MKESELIGTWRKVGYGDQPALGRHILHLLPDGKAVAEGEFRGESYRYEYDWKVTGSNEWEMRRIIPLGEIPEMDEESVDVQEHRVVAYDGHRMSLEKFDYEDPFIWERIS